MLKDFAVLFLLWLFVDWEICLHTVYKMAPLQISLLFFLSLRWIIPEDNGILTKK